MVLFVWTVISPTAIQRNVPTVEALKEFQRNGATENEDFERPKRIYQRKRGLVL